MSSWKRVLTTDDVSNTNIGSSDLTVPSSTNRSLTLGNSSSKFRIKNSTGANIFFQIQDDQVSLGAGDIACESATVSTAGSRLILKDDNTASFGLTNQFTISGIETGSAAGPILKLRRDESDASGAQDNDLIGQIKFSGDSQIVGGGLTIPTEVEYGNIQCIARDTDVTFDGSSVNYNQDGKFQFNVAIDGTLTPALTIDGQELHLHAEIEQHTFRLTSNEANGGTASPVIDLFSDSGSSAATDHIGEIRFRSDNGNSDPKTFADITAKIVDPVDGTEDGEINFNVIKGGSLTEVMSITSAGNDAAGVSATESEQRLKGIEVHGDSLELLTRRYMYQFDFSESSYMYSAGSSQPNASPAFPDLERSAVTPVYAENNYDNSYGFIVPYKSYLTGATFSYIKSGNSSIAGHAELEAIVVHVDGSDDTIVTLSTNHENNTNIYRQSVFHLAAGSQRSIELAPGDKIIPRVQIIKGTAAPGDYRIIDILGSFYLYAE